MKRSTASTALGGIALLAAAMLPAVAVGEVAPEKAIKSRQSAYYLMGRQMATINATVKGDLAFDKASLELNAQALEVLSKIVADQFPAGSEQGNTKAKPEIWKDQPKFNQLMQASQSEIAKLGAAVKTADLKAIKAAYGVTSKSCMACHDSFKAQ